MAPALRAQQELPAFKSSVELTSIDAGVVDDRGNPVTDLKPEDFTVRIDNVQRKVVSAEWISLKTPPGPEPPPPPDGFSSNDSVTGGRLILFLIDQPNIRFGGTYAIRKALFSFIDGLEPSDRAAVLGVGPGAPSTPFTGDHARLKKAIEGMAGQHQEIAFLMYGIGLSEALDIERGMPYALGDVVDRECRGMTGMLMTGDELQQCTLEIQQQANQMVLDTHLSGQMTVDTLRILLNALKAIDAPKTLFVVSEGFTVDDTIAVTQLGALSAAARTSIYALKLDDQLFASSASETHTPLSTMNDRSARALGLELLTSASRGSLFNIVGAGQGVFDRIEAEMSGYYLVGVESGPTDKDGKAHPIKVNVARKGVTVRARRALLAPPVPARPRTARDAVASALASPLPISALPLRVATYSLQGPEVKKVQLLIHADVGSDYSSPRFVSLGYVLTDADGRIVEGQNANPRLAPIMNGVPSPLQLSVGASLPPGDYTLKLAVVEGDRVGTIEHTVHAGVKPAGSLVVSDFMVGGPADASEPPLQPTVGYEVVFGSVHGYLEVYGSGSQDLVAHYEVASEPEGPAILQAEVRPRMAGASRAIFTGTMPVRQLPPGDYVMRATLSSAAGPLQKTSRPFHVATPAVLMTSAESSGPALVTDVYLPVSDAMLSRQFDRAEAFNPATVKAFRERVPEASRDVFDQGVQAMTAGDLAAAERLLKSAISPDEDSSAIIAYLAAVYAASGHDTEASGAWQTALIDGSELPQVYEWLADSLIRTRDLPTARSMLEEAIDRWPSDPRFARPMALINATFGQGIRAVRSLERYLAVNKSDVDMLSMGVEWIYQLHAAGQAAHSPAEDLKLAQTYADAYAKAKGPQMPLVRRWLEFLERKSGSSR
jgi:VWFA-related protein